MKKLLLIAAVAVFGFTNVNAQEDSSASSEINFGAKAGYNSFIARASAEGSSASVSESGFYLGFFADFEISEKFNVQPELQYVIVTGDGDNGNLLVLPILAKFKASEEFAIYAGPQFDYILDEETEGLKEFGFGLAAGISYDVTDNFFLDTRYSFGLSNRLEDDNIDGVDVKVKFNFFQVGLGYRF